ncbi:hypothetical protein PYW07_014415 [Mythimna separata]|uniref:Uncharacterized protein n=1 Tax=Mythimna separata TaxID=271217 RepID=A0AAD7Z0X7_MYTSE|nr:hypothetical protein PYW07_014415 [Mythimna separata]
MFTLTGYENITESQCGITVSYQAAPILDVIKKKVKPAEGVGSTAGFSFVTVISATTRPTDPLLKFENIFQELLYGNKAEVTRKVNPQSEDEDVDYLAHWPTGQVMRSEMFQDRGSVHLPFLHMHRGHSLLKVTSDYMQTAVDAFAIFISGDINDVLRLPGSYVLQSARTIAMMRVAREKLAATWEVVKGSTPTDEVPYETLEKFRPLFKYITGREMARLNLSDDKILSFIGTHPDLNRHQVGVVASKYIQVNPRWSEAKYLNLMNNLMCGVPMTFMRRIPENTYLQLTHQIFYHIRACDPLQRRFYLAMMMRTQALGKSYSWSAREVSRLGLLLPEVSGADLSAINPEAMSGLTAQVMLEMPIHSLRSITEMQIRNLETKPLNILARKLIAYQAQQLAASDTAVRLCRPDTTVVLIFSSLVCLSVINFT